MNPFNGHRRLLLTGVAALGLASTGLASTQGAQPIEVWKDPSCGCCKDWITYLEKNGFKVTLNETGNTAARARLGMPLKFGSCHTALVQGYVVEGHVPVADIRRLLKEKPNALGLTVPGMPVGSPGMDGAVYGGRRDKYAVLLVLKDGNSRVFSSHS